MSKEVTPAEEAGWLIERAKIYLKEGDLNEARFLLRHARALAPDRADEIDELSGRIEDALEQLEASRPQMFDFEIEAEAAERGKDEREIRRTPHMDVEPAALEMGQSFQVSIFADASVARPGEEATDISITLPDETPSVTLAVRLLASAHFEMDGPGTQPMTIERANERSGTAVFTLRVKTQTQLKTEALLESLATLTGVFEHLGRPCGRVSRIANIRGVTAAGDLASTSDSIAVDVAAVPPDLMITVVSDPANDGRQFWCTVQSRHLPEFADGVSERWNLPDKTLDIVRGYMDTFTKSGLGTRQRIAEMRGAGMKLFRASPAHFQRAFWQLNDLGVKVDTIAVVSEEPYIPWELMVPRRERAGRFETRNPLGADFAVGRWTRKDLLAGSQQLSLKKSYVVAPQYPPRRQLKFAQQEVAIVLAEIPGDRIDPATFDTIDETLGKDGRSMIHFACHGASAGAGRQAIALDNDVPLSSDAVGAMEGLAAMFENQRPVVFLNACEVGREEVGLAGVGGFAEAFIDLGASAVIGALWSVKDTIAHEIAKEFYAGIRTSPGVPLARILTSIRAKAYDPAIGEDSYAAYCFYGDPNATAVRSG